MSEHQLIVLGVALFVLVSSLCIMGYVGQCRNEILKEIKKIEQEGYWGGSTVKITKPHNAYDLSKRPKSKKN